MPHPEGLRVTPEMARQQMDALKRMQPDQLENLAAMAEHGGPPDAQQAAEMLKASTSVHASAQCSVTMLHRVTPVHKRIARGAHGTIKRRRAVRMTYPCKPYIVCSDVAQMRLRARSPLVLGIVIANASRPVCG